MVVVHDGRMSSGCIEVEDNKMQLTLFLNWVHHHMTLLQDHLFSSNSSSSAIGAKDYIHPHRTPTEPPASTCLQ
jgi:hypothetical protein